MLETAIILAGGFGTRLKTIIPDLPKPMAPVNGEPFLTYQLRYLQHFNIKKVILSLGHLAEKISSYYGNTFENIQINYVTEESPLGTGGGIRLALERCNAEEALILNGDSFFDVDLDRYYLQHKKEGSQISLALRQAEDVARFGTIALDSENRIVSFVEKKGQSIPGIINGGTYIVNKAIFMESTPVNQNFSIEKDFFEKQLRDLIIKGFEFKGYFIDIGIPDDYQKAQYDFKEFKYK